MVVVPRLLPVTTPEELTVAMVGVELDQVPVDGVLESVVVPPWHTVEEPDTVGADGGVATVTVIVA